MGPEIGLVCLSGGCYGFGVFDTGGEGLGGLVAVGRQGRSVEDLLDSGEAGGDEDMVKLGIRLVVHQF